MKSIFRGPKTEIRSKYQLKEVIGTGNFSEVRLGIHKDTKTKYAIKVSDIQDEQEYECIKQEIEILGRLDHPNIVKLHEIFETPANSKGRRQVFMVTELVEGGELFDRIVTDGAMSEEEAREIAGTMIDAIEYMHEHGVVHRDLKPENILLDKSSGETVIKIADFGLAKLYAPDSQTKEGQGDGSPTFHTMCGTPSYVAPEILLSKRRGGYGPEVDMWSVGIILYSLLCGFPPFYHEEQQLLFRQIIKEDLDFPSPEWDTVSPGARDFVTMLLQKDATKRMTPLQALKHPWMESYTRKQRKSSA